MRVEGLGAASQDIERKDLRKINRSLARLPLLALAAWVEDYSCCHAQFCRAKLLNPCGILPSEPQAVLSNPDLERMSANKGCLPTATASSVQKQKVLDLLDAVAHIIIPKPS